MGLTNNQQAVAMFISAVLIALGSVSVRSGLPMWVTTTFFILGALGFAIKEALGDTAPPVVVTQPPQDGGGSAGGGGGSIPTIIDMTAVAQAKAVNYHVFANSNYPKGIVLMSGGTWLDITGKILGSVIPAGTGSEL